MDGFAGMVDYTADFLHNMDYIIDRLWKLTGTAGGGRCRYGFDVVDENAAFTRDASRPVKPKDYCLRAGDRVYFLLHNGKGQPDKILKTLALKNSSPEDIDAACSGAFFDTAGRRLLLFRRPGGPEVYYTWGETLTFSTNRQGLEGLIPNGEADALAPGGCLAYEPEMF